MHSTKEQKHSASLGPSAYYSQQQMRSYLQDLRTNRPPRPTGSRPPPAHFKTWSGRASTRPLDSPNVPFSQRVFTESVVDADDHPPQAKAELQTHTRRTLGNSLNTSTPASGKALIQPPQVRSTSRSSLEFSRTSSLPYRENEQRLAEQNEARAVRIAMAELELAQEEKLFEAARDEAVELVYKHQNPGAPCANPNSPYAYPGLTRKKSTQRSRSVEPKEQDLQRANSKSRKRHSMGSATLESMKNSLQSKEPVNATDASKSARIGHDISLTNLASDANGVDEKSSALAKAASDLLSFKQRRRSSGSRRSISGSLFRNPNDQIYEEPEEETLTAPAPTVEAAEPTIPEKLPLRTRRNPFMRFQSTKGNTMTRSNTDPTLAFKKFDLHEIQKNPPSQSRNAEYTSNLPSAKSLDISKGDVENDAKVKTKDGKEIRGDDMRAATGFRLKDRSPKLPTPTAVSDAPGRPIVSFKKDWNVVELKEDTYAQTNTTRDLSDRKIDRPCPPTKAATLPAISIHSPDDRPTRTLDRQSTSSVPTVGLTLPSPTPSCYDNKPFPHTYHSKTSRNSLPFPTQSTSMAIARDISPRQQSRSTIASVVPTISISETPPVSVNMKDDHASCMKAPSMVVTPSIPSISINDFPASRQVTSPSSSVTTDIPIISVSDSSKPCPVPKKNAQCRTATSSTHSMGSNRPAGFGPAASSRPLPNPRHQTDKSHGFRSTTSSRTHWTPTTVRTGALCAHCALPIAGRIVSAAGSRFHPDCLTCYQCGEHLECVAFYPEPSDKHAERVERIRARMLGQDLTFLPTHPTYEDMARLECEDGSDESPRFFCHLDFHELFSPRCKSCKTPIEGEVIVACGSEWHVGHFFCAQCGDPFDSNTPFVEKEGYAWCVNCHTNRFSTKCKGCRKPVTDMVIKALGAEWHVNCFICKECSGPFQDGRYFLRGESQDPVCVKCEERRLKA